MSTEKNEHTLDRGTVGQPPEGRLQRWFYDRRLGPRDKKSSWLDRSIGATIYPSKR